MIDFDLTQLENTLYPSNYNSSIEERHMVARASRPMKKSHDIYVSVRGLRILFQTHGTSSGTSLGSTSLRSVLHDAGVKCLE